MMAMPVPVTSVVKKTLPIYLDYPGRIESIRNIALQARVSGYIDAQPASDGADVKSRRAFCTGVRSTATSKMAAFDQAGAQAQRDAASLEYARANFTRGEELVKSGFVTQDVYDQRESALHQAEAALASSTMPRSQAAKLNLGYAEIRAPFAGRLGRNQAAKGALVGPASGPAPTRSFELDRSHVSFERQQVRSRGNRRGARRRQSPGRGFFGRQTKLAPQGQIDPSSTTWSATGRRARSPPGSPSPTRTLLCCLANMFACGCTSRISRTLLWRPRRRSAQVRWANTSMSSARATRRSCDS